MVRFLVLLTVVLAGAFVAAAAANARQSIVPVVKAGHRVVFAPGALPRGRLVYCMSHGIRASGRVPARGQSTITIADGVAGASATLRLAVYRDGSVVATCR